MSKIYSDKQKLKEAIPDQARVVFTNGCFDIIHIGHVDYLAKAKTKGDVLIVGLNTDESIKKLKGKLRPIFKLEDRAKILSAFSFVDFIVPFAEETPLELITFIEPDILIKASDYEVEDIVGSKEVLAKGGKVETIEIIHKISTSDIINRIKNI